MVISSITFEIIITKYLKRVFVLCSINFISYKLTSHLGIQMKTFRDKHFKNKLDPKAVYYDCIRSCELSISTEQGVENCIIKCKRPLAATEGYRYLKAVLVQ